MLTDSVDENSLTMKEHYLSCPSILRLPSQFFLENSTKLNSLFRFYQCCQNDFAVILIFEDVDICYEYVSVYVHLK